MLITDPENLLKHLAQVQAARECFVRVECTQACTVRLTDAAIDELLITGLPMAQGIKRRILRSRGQGMVITAKVFYRQGVRMAEYAAGKPMQLTLQEVQALSRAGEIAGQMMCMSGEADRCEAIYRWLCRHVRYVHTAPGRKGYERLVGAVGALLDGEANCQGFADATYLLCRMCGLEAKYCCGQGERMLHVWNEVGIDGEWKEIDASKGARMNAASGS